MEGSCVVARQAVAHCHPFSGRQLLSLVQEVFLRQCAPPPRFVLCVLLPKSRSCPIALMDCADIEEQLFVPWLAKRAKIPPKIVRSRLASARSVIASTHAGFDDDLLCLLLQTADHKELLDLLTRIKDQEKPFLAALDSKDDTRITEVLGTVPLSARFPVSVASLLNCAVPALFRPRPVFTVLPWSSAK